MGNPPAEHNSSLPQFSKEDEFSINLETQKLLAKGVRTKCEHGTADYISSIFIRQKPDGPRRLILNPKDLNEDVPCIHFKRQTLQLVLLLITPGCYFASLDLKYVYYSVPLR